ncbi:MAG: hypothetical protein JSU04_10255 [Bdellovibrionales bacterium]|nr:hypothetical protein [Bdellovibrionales bacterium]
MKKWSAFVISLILVSQSWAELQGNGYRVESNLGSECIDCQNGDSPMDALMRFTQNMSVITDGVLDIEIISDKFNYAEKCDNFAAKENGELNKWGTVITREIEKERCAPLLNQGPRDIKNYCPNFKNMDPLDKKALYVLIMAAMTHYESSCNFREKAPGPNGTAAGLLQLHKGKEQKYSSGCRQNDSLNAERSLACGVAMVCDQTAGRGENLFSSASYWEVLRPRGRSQKAKKIMAAIRKFGPCDPASANAKRNNNTRVAQK